MLRRANVIFRAEWPSDQNVLFVEKNQGNLQEAAKECVRLHVDKANLARWRSVKNALSVVKKRIKRGKSIFKYLIYLLFS